MQAPTLRAAGLSEPASLDGAGGGNRTHTPCGTGFSVERDYRLNLSISAPCVSSEFLIVEMSCLSALLYKALCKSLLFATIP